MASTNFVAGTTIASTWLNDVNSWTYTAQQTSIAGLRTVDKTKVAKVLVSGYYTPGDGGGGQYWYDSTDTTSTDNGATIIVASDGGRWKLANLIAATEKQYGAKVDGTTDDHTVLQKVAMTGDWLMGDGTRLVKSNLSFTQPVSVVGRGVNSIIKIASDFTNGADLFTISPAAGTERRNWEFTDFQVNNAGSAARDVFLIDIAAAGKYLSKLRIKGVVADATTNYFVELLNSIPNADGLFTGVFEDNWSLGGYYLDNVGDSFILQRNTTTGAGRGYYINQLDGASHIIIRDGNCTSTGGVLIAHAFNLMFENMQCECSSTYTGTGTGLITLQNGSGAPITNVRIRDNNINVHGSTNTTLACLYINSSDAVEIEGNTLFTNASTGSHIIITSASSNVYIGPNKYYNQTGAEITPIIQDSGVGTMGIWKTATNTTWTTGGINFFKSKDGVVSLRGNLSGTASTVGQVLTTLPVGFRPSTAQNLVVANGAAVAFLAISTAGVVTLTVNGQTGCYFDGLSFSTK